MQKEFKYKANFESIAHTIDVPQQYIASASSLDSLRSILPANIDYERNYDLLGFAGNGAVINKANKNGHIIDSKTAVAMNKYFINKPLDLEHNRKNIVGVILNVGLSDFGTNEIISEEVASLYTKPFNIVMGGIVFRIVNADFANLLEQSSQPGSQVHEAVSLSWEVGFSDYYITIGSPYLSEAEVVTKPSQIDELSKFLLMNGGTNQLQDGTPIYQYIVGNDVLPLAFAFTTRPAAEVKGVITQSENNDPIEIITASLKEINHTFSKGTQNHYIFLCKQCGDTETCRCSQANKIKIQGICDKCKNILSHNSNSHVNINSTKSNMSTINNLDELYARLKNDDLKEVSASNMYDVIHKKMTEISEKFVAETQAKDAALATAKDLQNSIDILTKKMDALASAQEAERAEAAFNARMSLVDAEFDLTPEDRKAIASDISACSTDTDFETWYSKFSIYASGKVKGKGTGIPVSQKNSVKTGQKNDESPIGKTGGNTEKGDNGPAPTPNAKAAKSKPNSNDDDTDDDSYASKSAKSDDEDWNDEDDDSKDDKKGKSSKADDDTDTADAKDKSKKKDMKAAIASATEVGLKKAVEKYHLIYGNGVTSNETLTERYKNCFNKDGISIGK